MVPDFQCDFVGTTGEKALDDRIMELAQSVSGVSDHCLLAEMMTTAKFHQTWRVHSVSQLVHLDYHA